MHQDERGFIWRCSEIVDSPYDFSIIVSNPYKYTLRGMHYQVSPFMRSKLIRVISGSVRLVTIELEDENRGQVVEKTLQAGQEYFVTATQATGYLTLADNTVLHYQMSVPQSPEDERGIRWNDPLFAIDWGVLWNWGETPLISERDKSWPLLERI